MSGHVHHDQRQPHHHGHHHHMGKVLNWSLAVTVVFVVIEVFAGLQAHSLALLSDAGHNLTDAIALLLAVFAYRVQQRPPNEIKTYGYHRAGVLAAFVNAIILLALAAYIFYESYERLLRPEAVDEFIMFVMAGVGLAINGAIMWGLHNERKHDLNIRAAWVHMLGDALGSIGILAGAAAIYYTDWFVIDPILSIIIGGLIVWTAWDIVKDSLNILLEGLPRGMDLKTVLGAILEVEGVADVHDLHIWSLGSSTHALSCHVVIADVPPSESETILKRLNTVLQERFHIHHTTVQFEHQRCELTGNGCVIPVHGRH